MEGQLFCSILLRRQRESKHTLFCLVSIFTHQNTMSLASIYGTGWKPCVFSIYHPYEHTCVLRSKASPAIAGQVVVAERLRRQTRNLVGFPLAGSNPDDYDHHGYNFVSVTAITDIPH